MHRSEEEENNDKVKVKEGRKNERCG